VCIRENPWLKKFFYIDKTVHFLYFTGIMPGEEGKIARHTAVEIAVLFVLLVFCV